MNKFFSLIGKILLSILIFITLIFLIFWYRIYKDSNKKGIDRITDSLGGALLYFIWGILAFIFKN
jgi:hypothetical protein